MNIENKFFIILLITVLIVRVFLFVDPISSPTIKGFRIHHYMYGIVGIPVAILTGSLPLYAISVALFEDEFTYTLMGGKTQRDNYSAISIIGTILFVVLTFFLRKYLVLPLLR